MIFLLQAGYLLDPCKRAFTGDHSDSPLCATFTSNFIYGW